MKQKIKKIIMFIRGIETLWYFSEQMGKTFEELGYEVFYFDQCREYESLIKLVWFCEPGATAAVSFNYDGCAGEEYFLDSEGVSFFDAYDILYINIVVDHPFYYHKFRPCLPKKYIHLSIDREHDAYMKRFFPELKRGPFLPLAGTALWEKEEIPGWDERPYDVVFAGNYNPPDIFHEVIHRHGDEYADFYYRIIQDLLDHPWKSVDAVILEHLDLEVEGIDEADRKEIMPNMIFIDLYVRHYMRGEVVKTLADSGILVHCFGAGWDKLACKHPENIINGNVLDSLGCLQQIGWGKISLNVMPWFKDGAHDRVFNSMLNGAVCLSDGSKYMSEILQDGKDYIQYDMSRPEMLPDLVRGILGERERWEYIQKQGYETAKAGHTWAHRARRIHSEILCKIL